MANETSAVEILIKARSLIAKPEHWVQRMNAADEYGSPRRVMDHNACRYCATGAFSKITWGQRNVGARSDAWSALKNEVPDDGSLIQYNDLSTTTHEDILDLYDRAIDSLRRVSHV